MTALHRLAQALDEVGVRDDDAEISLCSEAALLEAAQIPAFVDEHIVSVKARHEGCPSDCYMPAPQFALELMLLGRKLEHRAAPFEAAWRSPTLPHISRVRALGEWSSWVVLAGVLTEQQRIHGGTVTKCVHMMRTLAHAWPDICGDIYGPMLNVEVPTDLTGLDS